MAGKTKIVTFSEQSRSRLSELFSEQQSVLQPKLHFDKKADIEQYLKLSSFPDYVSTELVIEELSAGVTLNDIQMKFIKSIPFSSERVCQVDLNAAAAATNEISGKQVDAVMRQLLQIPKANGKSYTIEMICVCPMPNVEYRPAQVVSVKNDGDSRIRSKFVNPSLRLQLPACAPNSFQQINTGYIIDLPTKADNFKIEQNKIVRLNKPPRIQSESVVIIPQIVCDDKSIVPCVTARDKADQGILFLNFYNIHGNATTVDVYFHAFNTSNLFGNLFINTGHGKSSTDQIIKPKDQSAARNIKNLKVKVDFSAGTIDGNCKTVTFPILNSTNGETLQKAVAANESVDSNNIVVDKLRAERCTLFFPTRKRHAMDENILSLCGLFNGNGGCNNTETAQHLLPVAYVTPKFGLQNTHCVVGLTDRLTLYATESKLTYKHNIINGSFHTHLLDYKSVKKAMETVKSAIDRLARLEMEARLFKRINDTTAKNYDFWQLLKIGDYHIALEKTNKFDEIYEYDDRKLFNVNAEKKKSISASLYSNMLFLYKVATSLACNSGHTTASLLSTIPSSVEDKCEKVATAAAVEAVEAEAAVVVAENQTTNTGDKDIKSTDIEVAEKNDITPIDDVNKNDCLKRKLSVEEETNNSRSSDNSSNSTTTNTIDETTAESQNKRLKVEI